MDFWDYLNNLEAETTAWHDKNTENFRAVESYIPAEPEPLIRDVEIAPSQIKALKAMQRKEAAKSAVFSAIRSLRNQGKSAEEIFLLCQNDKDFHRAFGKNLRKDIYNAVELSDQWDRHKNTILIADYLIKHTVDIMNCKMRKDKKALLPLFLTISTLFTMKDCNRKAIVATRVVRSVGASVTLNRVDLDPTNQKKRWIVLAKELKCISFYPGKAGGDSNRVEILPNHNVYSTESKLKAVALILGFVDHEELHQALSAVLHAIAVLEDSPRYGDCELTNLVSTLLDVFTPLADGVIQTRKAERLIESADFESAVEAEATELADKISAHLKSGTGFQPRSKPAKAPQIHVEARTLITRPSLRAQAQLAAEKLSRLHGSTVTTRTKYTASNIGEGLEW